MEEFLSSHQRSSDQTFLDPHTEWQHNTVLGRLTLLLHRLGDNPITHAVVDAFKSGDDSGFNRVLKIGATISAIIIGVAAAYAVSRILQLFIGQEIVINQEVVIEEEVKLSDILKQLENDGNSEAGQITEPLKKRTRGKTESTKKTE